MSSPAEQFFDDPDDRDGDRGDTPREHAGRRRRTLQEQARATLARKVARVDKAHRKIAKATAQRARDLAELQRWSTDPVTAKLLNPDYPAGPGTGSDTGPTTGATAATPPGRVFTDADASPRKIPAWEEQEIARRTIITEVACTLHLAERTAESLIGEAVVFAGPMKATLTAMSTGAISYRHGQVLMEQLCFLPLEEAERFEAQLLPVAGELTVGRLRARARRLRERAHPETISQRAKAAVADRAVWWEGRPDGMGTLTWYGTAQQTLAAHDRLTSIATATRTAEHQDESIPEDHRRSIAQICADAIGDLLLDGVTPAGTGGGIRGSVMVTVPVLTVMGTSTEPGCLEGYGPIPPEVARELAAGAPSFTRLLTHPETGAVLSVGNEQYRVPADLRRVLRLRDGTCRFPGCTRPAARSDIDHTNAWETGGPTDMDNLAHLCRLHHRLKHQTLWAVQQEPGGILVWTSPAGKTHRTYPETYLGPPITRPDRPNRPQPTTPTTPDNPPKRGDPSTDPPPF
jgi:hypothetical protein